MFLTTSAFSMFTIKFAIISMYGFPSAALYIMTIRMIFKHHKDFAGSFFNLYIASFVFNFTTFISTFITLKVSQNTCKDCLMSFLFKAHSETNYSWFPLNIFFTIHYGMSYIQQSMIMLMCINRFTMIFFLFSYEKIWKIVFPVALVAVVCLAISQTYEITINRAYYEYTTSLNYVTRTKATNTDAILRNLVAFVLMTVIITAIINFLSLIKLMLSKSSITKSERNLFYISLCAFVVQFGTCINILLIRLVINDTNRTTFWAQFAQQILPFTSDASNLSEPWILILFSKRARILVKQMYFPVCISSKSTSILIQQQK